MLATCACAQSCPILHDLMNCSSPGSSVHEISQATTLKRVAISCSRGPSWPRDWTCLPYVACIGRRILYHWRHLVAQIVKNPRAMQETWAGSVGKEDPPWRRACNPLRCSCLENPHGQRTLTGYGPLHGVAKVEAKSSGHEWATKHSATWEAYVGWL